MGVGWTTPTPALVAFAGTVALACSVVAQRRVSTFALLVGWTLLGAALAMPGTSRTAPAFDGPLVFSVVLGPAQIGTRQPRSGQVVAAWPQTHGGARDAIWTGPLTVALRLDAARVAGLGQGSHLLVKGTLAEERSGWVLRASRGPWDVRRASPVTRWRHVVKVLRRRVRRVLGVYAHPELRALFVALVLGDRAELDPALRATFARTGTSHLLAISGLHIGTAWLGVRALLRRALLLAPVGLSRGGAVLGASALLAWCCAAAYVVLAGAPVSGQRALGMLAAVTVAALARRRVSPWNTLSAAVVAVLIVDPAAVASLGFQLSVASVAFLIAWTPADDPASHALSRLHRAVRLSLWTGALGSLATAPLVGRVWGQVPLSGVWTNAVAVPLLGGATVPPLLLGSALGAVHPQLAAPWIGLANATGSAGVAAVRWFASPERAPLWGWQPSIAAVVLVYGVAAGAMAMGRRR